MSLSATVSEFPAGCAPSCHRQVGTRDIGVTWLGESRVWWVLALPGPWARVTQFLWASVFSLPLGAPTPELSSRPLWQG